MSHANFVGRRALCILACALISLAAPWIPAHADSQVEEHRPASSQGSVEIINVAGEINLQGWDKPEVAVTGTVGKNVERVDVTGGADRISIHVILRSQHFGFGSDGEAHLLVHVPINSSVSTSLVSSDLRVSAVRGDLKLQTVSGNISGEGGGDVHANSVSGNVTINATAAKVLEVKAVSGDVVVTGGNADTEVTTVSGNAKITLGTPSRARLQSVSGDFTANFALGPDAQIDGESVSGNVKLEFANNPSAEFDIQTFSGDIRNCFGPKPEEARHGPGSRLTFKTGDNRARVRISTKSGDVRICAKGA
ncbi:MAG TPA: DUF4097 family beta strand repeat-containing protein [Steroidobacteraceae bacterium]|jgi:DUF4097 and DUF4098 domain-containing protein YvlB|nr:DUF4097 family beta strand repeat-containing protein [Steroidobacteraceae bacterium]